MKTRNRIFKLRSGEDVIANVKGKSGDKYILDRPMSIKAATFHNGLGISEEKILMRNWLSTSVADQIKIPEDWIIAITTPTDDVDKQYLQNLENEDIEPGIDNTVGLPESYLKLIEDMKKEEEVMKKLQPPKEKSVLINMALPPEVFMEMLKNGMFEAFPEEMDGEGEEDDDDWFFDSNRFKGDWDGGL